MKSDSARQFFIIAFLLSLAIGITVHFPSFMGYFFGANRVPVDGHGFIPPPSHILGHFIITFIIAFLMFALNFFILKPLEKHGSQKPLILFIAIILTLISVYVLNELSFSLLNSLDGTMRPRRHRDEFDYTNFFVSALVIGSVLIIRLIYQKQNISLENEALKNEALQSQFESLKNQLSPHFLFNSLTALKTLIREAPDKAQDYINSLSKALRYTLQSNEKKIVTLAEEMEFMESYLFLIRMRFDTNLSIDVKISEAEYKAGLPPLTVQTLVENAIKHNEISKRKPLAIHIYTTDNESLIVSNNINRKLTDEEGTGIGLTNLSKQFQLLPGRAISVTREPDRFSVEVPLIKL